MEILIGFVWKLGSQVAIFVSQACSGRPFAFVVKPFCVAGSHACRVVKVGKGVVFGVVVIEHFGVTVVLSVNVFAADFQFVVFSKRAYIVQLECLLGETLLGKLVITGVTHRWIYEVVH